jgi:hypothetical protein
MDNEYAFERTQPLVDDTRKWSLYADGNSACETDEHDYEESIHVMLFLFLKFMVMKRRVSIKDWFGFAQYRQRFGYVHIPNRLRGGEQFARVPNKAGNLSEVGIVGFHAVGIYAEGIA